MPLSDYAHWNEDAEYMWWHEEGKHIEEPPDPDDDRGWDDLPQLADHDATGDECIADGEFSSRGGVEWTCDACEGDLVFTRDNNGDFHVRR